MQVTILGTGILGQAIAERLHRSGLSVTVYNRTRSKAEGLSRLGITVAASCEDAIRSGDVVLLLLADASAIHSMLERVDGRLLTGRMIMQMGTIAPAESRSLNRDITEEGGEYCEAPVLGSVTEAQAGSLIVLFGGNRGQLERWTAFLRRLSPSPTFVGAVGQAAALKLALNQLIAAETAAFALSLGLVQREHIDVALFMEVLRSSALFAPTFEKKLGRLQKRDYSRPNFSTRHLLKDVELVLDEARMCGLATSGLEGVVPLLKAAITSGWGDQDYSALFETINSRSGSS